MAFLYALNLALAILALSTPHPITWLMVLLAGGILFGVMIPKYRSQSIAEAKGIPISAKVVGLREWERGGKENLGQTFYEIKLQWQDPKTGKSYHFTSKPLTEKPNPLPDSLPVLIDPENPQHYAVQTDSLRS